MANDPYQRFSDCLTEAVDSQCKLPEAMILSTCTDNRPSSRVVLFKDFYQEASSEQSKGLSFYTNYDSKKSQELIANPYASLLFYWTSIDKQIRIEGQVKKVSAEESDKYFASRPRGSQISASVSKQSAVISSHENLKAEVDAFSQQHEGQDIQRPLNWGGFYLVPDYWEFWTNGKDRLHEREIYKKAENSWIVEMISP